MCGRDQQGLLHGQIENTHVFCAQGKMPAVSEIVAVRNQLLQSSDLRRVSNLEMQLKSQANLSEDASQSLVSLLQVLFCRLGIEAFCL